MQGRLRVSLSWLSTQSNTPPPLPYQLSSGACTDCNLLQKILSKKLLLPQGALNLSKCIPALGHSSESVQGSIHWVPQTSQWQNMLPTVGGVGRLLCCFLLEVHRSDAAAQALSAWNQLDKEGLREYPNPGDLLEGSSSTLSEEPLKCWGLVYVGLSITVASFSMAGFDCLFAQVS